jgi:8-oxo-dGTP diphosphatase
MGETMREIQKALLLPVNSRGEIFIQDRRGHKKPDWGFFGGSIEAGETPVQAVIRETEEELSLKIEESNLASLGISETDWDGVHIIRYLFLYKTDQETFDVKEGRGGSGSLSRRPEIILMRKIALMRLTKELRRH